MSHVTKATYVGDGSTVIFAIPFPYINQSDVVVTVNGTPASMASFPSPSSVQLSVAPAASAHVVVQRETAIDTLPATIQAGTIAPADINANDKVLLYRAQESDNRLTDVESGALDIEAAVATCETDAAACETALSDFNSLISTYGIPFASTHNIFELLTPTEIANIKAYAFTIDIQAKVQAAMTANPFSTWFWPAGGYSLNALTTLSLPAGIRWIGAGIQTTQIKLSNNGTWGIEQLNVNGTTQIKGFSASFISFYITNNGIRLNSAAGGFDDTAGTQCYMGRPIFEECEFIYNASPSTKTLLQFNKCFNGGVDKCTFNGGHVQFHNNGSDITWVERSRFDLATDVCVLDNSQNTFGSSSRISHNDMNNPKNTFVRGNSRDTLIEFNHMELDFSPGSSGVGGNMVAAIDILAGNAFKTVILYNRIAADPFADHWLRYASSSCYSLVAIGNGDTNSGAASGSVGVLPYFTNSGTRTVCIHNGNLFLDGDGGFPMNTMAHDTIAGIVRCAILSAGRPGVNNQVGLGPIFGGVKCSGGDFLLQADGNTAHVIEFSDWSGWPANNILGTVDISVESLGGVNGQVLSWELLDGASVVSSGTITHTTAFTRVLTKIATAQAFTTKMKIQVWNADTTRNNAVFIRHIEVD